MSESKRPVQLFRNMSAKIAAIPMILTALVIFVGCTIWTIVHSFTKSKLLPNTRWVGFDQYERLFSQNTPTSPNHIFPRPEHWLTYQ